MTRDMPWFRFYNETIDDKKFIFMSRELEMPKIAIIGIWSILLARASESPRRGFLYITSTRYYTDADLADDAGISIDEWLRVKQALIEMEMIDLQDDAIHISNWDKRQFQSDNVTERTRKYRTKKEQQKQQEESESGNVPASFQGTNDSVSASASVSDSVKLINTPKAQISTTIPGILMRSANLSAIPPSEIQRIEQITCLLETYGVDRVETALKNAAQRWIGTKNKNGRMYPITNMAWVDWAQDELDNGSSQPITWAIWETWPDTRKREWLDAGNEMPYG